MAEALRLKKAFEGVQKSLSMGLEFASSSIEHCPTKGSVHEDLWISLLRKYLPRRYEVSGGIVVDSNGGLSDQIDVVIYDPQYTPLLDAQGAHKYIPVEAVYAVFECKYEINAETLKYAARKVASVRSLHRTSIKIHHAGGIFNARKLFDIVGGILAPRAGWSTGLDNENLVRKSILDSAKQKLDCGCALNHGVFIFEDGKLEIKNGDTSLMYFLFQLLSKLQTLATVPAIDWQAYAKIVE